MATGLEIKQVRELHIVRWFIILTLLGVVGLAVYYGFRWYTTGEEPPFPIPVASADPSIDESMIAKNQIESYTVPALHPRFLSIPAIGIVETRVTSVGVNERGLLDVPKNINDAGWYTKSKTPGEGYGAVLLDGHRSGTTKKGVFAKINKLKKDDVIKVERGDGKLFKYAVYDVRDMSLEQVNKTGMKEMMFSAEQDKEGLNLIANSGKWVPKDNVYSHRTMLRAIRIE